MSFLFSKRVKILKKITRVINAHVINFYIINKRYKILGFMEFCSRGVVSDYDPSKVDVDEKYETDMFVHAAEYTILANNHELLTNHIKEINDCS